ncbi:MAG: inositol monophosphatase [Thermotogae bacterium]|nr:MAG: inositol monophosphatase [Thermotogota bacterium]
MDRELIRLANEIANSIADKMKNEDKNKLRKNIGIGADGTPTKLIDKVAEDIAVEKIQETSLPVNLLSEEAGFLDFGGIYTIILDPIDGTRNAVRGIPFYAVSVAIGKERLKDVEYGIVINIPTGDTFFAEKGKGSYLNNQRIISPQYVPKKPLYSIMMNKGIPEYIFENHIRSLGAASLELSLVATGAIDCFVCMKDYLRVTDLAAGALIVREAGGYVYNAEGKELDMGMDVTERTSVIAATSEKLIFDILSSNQIKL